MSDAPSGDTPNSDTPSGALYARVLSAIGRQYELEGEIGRGGMSVVYRARDPRLNRLVAIKVLPPELAYDPAVRTRFTREAQTSTARCQDDRIRSAPEEETEVVRRSRQVLEVVDHE